MRRLGTITLLLTLAATVLSQAAPIRWVHNPEVLIPSSSDRPLLLYFHLDSDRSARRMQTWTFTDPGVAEQAHDFATIMIEMRAAPNIAAHFGITESPTLIAITPTQRVLNQHTGFLDADEVIDFLVFAQDELTATERLEAGYEDPGEEEETAAPISSNGLFLEEPLHEPVGDQTGFHRAGRIIVPQHRPVEFGNENEAIPIQVNLPDRSARVTLHWRIPSRTLFNDVLLNPNTPETFYGVIPALGVTLHGVEYYITVAIGSQSMTLPAAGSGRPYQIGVR